VLAVLSTYTLQTADPAQNHIKSYLDTEHTPALLSGNGRSSAFASRSLQAYTAGLNCRTSRKASRSLWYSTTATLECASITSQRRFLPAGQDQLHNDSHGTHIS
jgi:hypothetical protein